MSDPLHTHTIDPREQVLAARQIDALGPYRLIEIVGEGGMGAVYRAEQVAPVRREVAIKVTRVDLGSVSRLARFEAERQILAELSHPNIARVFDAGETVEGYPYLVMEYLAGAPIDRYCDSERLAVRARIALVLDLCAALTHAHQHGIIHRDVKPANVLIDLASGRAIPKLIDFGIARLVEGKTPVITETGRSVGTPAYMSPEQTRAERDIDIRVDVYALGMTLYRLLAGTLPTESKTLSGDPARRSGDPLMRPSRSLRLSADAAEIAARCQSDAHELIRTLSHDLDWIILKATDPDRERRYESVAALGDDLRRYLDGFPVRAAPPSGLDVLRKFVLRHRYETALFMLLIGAIGLGFLLTLRAWHSEREAHALAAAQLLQHEQFNLFVTDLMRGAGDAQRVPPETIEELIADGEALLASRYQAQPALRLALAAVLHRVAVEHRAERARAARDAAARTQTKLGSEPPP